MLNVLCSLWRYFNGTIPDNVKNSSNNEAFVLAKKAILQLLKDRQLYPVPRVPVTVPIIGRYTETENRRATGSMIAYS